MYNLSIIPITFINLRKFGFCYAFLELNLIGDQVRNYNKKLEFREKGKNLLLDLSTNNSRIFV